MIELIQATNDPAFAQRCEALGGFRLWVDLELLGKRERQGGRDTFISSHQLSDVGRVKKALRHAPLMVRVNPLHEGSAAEIDAVVAQGADRLMLPMFRRPEELAQFCRLVAGRVPVTALVETPGALDSMQGWLATPGLDEVYVGLNDLHLALGLRFMFEPLALGLVDKVAQAARAAGLRFGFGGVARMDQGQVPGRDVLAEHLRLGSQAVILARAFHAPDGAGLEQDVAELRRTERQLRQRSPAQVEEDARRIAARIRVIAAAMARAA